MAVYYVDKGVGAGGAGTEGAPFDSILDAFDACFPLAGDPATRQPLAEDTTIYLKSTSGTPDVVASDPTMEYTGGSTLTLIQTDRTSPLWDDSKYRLVRANGMCLVPSGSGGSSTSMTHRLTCLNVQFEQSSVDAADQTMLYTHTEGGRRGIWLFDSCLMKGSGNTAYRRRVFQNTADRRFGALTVMRNCIVFNMGNGDGHLFRSSNFGYSPGATLIVNNTFDCSTFTSMFLGNSSNGMHLVHVLNNIINLQSYGSSRERLGNAITSDYNACFFGDADIFDGETFVWSHGINDIINISSLPFTDAAAGDYRLSQADTNVVNQGSSFAANYPMPGTGTPDAPGFTHDHLETNTRPQGAAWDIGAFEFVAPEIINYPRFLMGPRV